jgi:HSP20 family protein
MADLIKWKPFHSLMQDFFKDLDPMFDQPALLRPTLDYQPRMDLKETDKDVTIFLDTPGMEKKDIDISIEANVLVMKGERKGEGRKTEDGYVHTERFFGSFERRVRLPENIESDKIKADYKDGSLTVTIPRAKIEKPEAKKIKIN